MNIGVLGTGIVGNTIGSKLTELGHKVMMGSRAATNEKALAWKGKAGANASVGTFKEAAAFGELLCNCTSGSITMDVLKMAGGENLKGKILIDISNPLDFSKGMPPTLTVCNTDSVGEQIQRTYSDLKVVKTLNTVTAMVMVNPGMLHGEHDMLLCGNDMEAKAKVESILREWFGWKTVHDIGDISGARAMEMYLPLWLRIYMKLGSPNFNIHIAK